MRMAAQRKAPIFVLQLISRRSSRVNSRRKTLASSRRAVAAASMAACSMKGATLARRCETTAERDANLGVELADAEVTVVARKLQHHVRAGEEVGAEAYVAALARPDED